MSGGGGRSTKPSPGVQPPMGPFHSSFTIKRASEVENGQLSN